MDWFRFDLLPDKDAAIVAMAAAVVVLLWQWRRWQYERKEFQREKEMPIYPHRFDSEPILNRMEREREILFKRHRVPAGAIAARARRVVAARAKLWEQDLLHEEP